MPLPARIKSLDEVDEAYQAEYEQQGEEYVLQVEGIKEHPSVTALQKAYEEVKQRAKERAEKLKAFGDRTPEDIQQLEQELEEARQSGASDEKVEEIKKTLAEKYEKQVKERDEQLEKYQGHLHHLHVERSLDSAIEQAGIDPRYKPAVRSLLKERGPQAKETDEGTFKGVFPADPDGIPGEHPIEDYVSRWAQTDEAKPFLPVAGSGGSGADPKGGREGSTGGQKVSAEGGVVRTDPAKVVSGEVEVAVE